MRAWSGLLLLAVVLGMGGCKSPLRTDEPAAEKKPPARGSAPFGEFNLQRRHGQGDWSRKPAAGEAEVMRQAASGGKEQP